MNLAAALSPDEAIAAQSVQALTSLVAIAVLYLLISPRIRRHLSRGLVAAGIAFVVVVAPLVVYAAGRA